MNDDNVRNTTNSLCLLVDGDTGKILGAHMVRADAGKIMQGISIAIKTGATKADF